MNKLLLIQSIYNAIKYLPKKYSIHGNLTHQPFFVFGSGRNGSTLLNRILNEHQELFLPSEQYFIGPSILRYHIYNYCNWERLIFHTTRELLRKGSHSWKLDSRQVSENLLRYEEKNRNLQSTIDAIYRANIYRSTSQLLKWGDTTPVNTFYYKEIFGVFPEGKYIFLLRDGRDVAASYKAGGPAFGHIDGVESSSRFWKKSIRAYKWLSKRTNILLVRYEDLVTTPEDVLDKIFNYLSISPLENSWSKYVEHIPQEDFYEASHHHNIRKLPFADSIGKWKMALTTDEKKYCEDTISKELAEFGYQIS